MLHWHVSIVALTKLNTGSKEGLSCISLKVRQVRHFQTRAGSF